MDAERAVAVVALVWLVASVLVMSRSIRRGRTLADALAARHPATYEALGRPRPGYLESVRRNRFARFVGRRAYEDLPDPALAAEFETFRKAEARQVVGVVASGAIVALLALVARHAS